jgi:hypothetical protein
MATDIHTDSRPGLVVKAAPAGSRLTRLLVAPCIASVPTTSNLDQATGAVHVHPAASSQWNVIVR